MTRTPSATRTATRTGTPTPLDPGPRIGYFGIFRADSCPLGCTAAACCSGTPTQTPEINEDGIEVFTVRDPRAGIIVVEGFPRPGGAALPPSPLLELTEDDPRRPDIWIESNRPLGNGSTTVCDRGAPPPIGGGIPAVPTPDFTPHPPSHPVEKAIKDFACRFNSFKPGNACTRDAFGNPAMVNAATTMQYCDVVDQIEEFPGGDTLLTVQLPDKNGVPGPTAQIIVRVPPTPTP